MGREEVTRFENPHLCLTQKHTMVMGKRMRTIECNLSHNLRLGKILQVLPGPTSSLSWGCWRKSLHGRSRWGEKSSSRSNLSEDFAENLVRSSTWPETFRRGRGFRQAHRWWPRRRSCLCRRARLWCLRWVPTWGSEALARCVEELGGWGFRRWTPWSILTQITKRFFDLVTIFFWKVGWGFSSINRFSSKYLGPSKTETSSNYFDCYSRMTSSVFNSHEKSRFLL